MPITKKRIVKLLDRLFPESASAVARANDSIDPWNVPHFVVPCPGCGRQMSYHPSEGYAWRCRQPSCWLSSKLVAQKIEVEGELLTSEPCPKCGAQIKSLPSGVKCSNEACDYWFCF